MTKQNNAEQVRKSKIDSLFTLVKDEENKINIVVGNNRVSNAKFDTFEQADQYIGRKPYELIFNISYLICKHYDEEKELSKKSKKTAKETKTSSENN